MVAIIKENKEKSYEVRLLCRNCNTDWIENVEKGIYVRSEKDNNYMIRIGDSYENRILFTCPNCKAQKKIARLPLC